jgi:hypothetical protein
VVSIATASKSIDELEKSQRFDHNVSRLVDSVAATAGSLAMLNARFPFFTAVVDVMLSSPK